MDDFVVSALEIPFYQDDPFPLQDTIFQYLQHHATSSNSLLTSVLPSVETDRPVFTEPAATTTAAAAAVATTTTTKSSSAATTKAAATTTTTTTTTNKKGKRGRTPSKVKDNGCGVPSDRNEKRIVHKELERGRRNEMSKLYASLKKLLPAEYIKAKSAVPDHVHQATNYIKHKEKTIRELEMKRNKLKSQLGADMGVSDGQVARSFSSTITFTVESCSDGSIEILMKSDLAHDWFPLSKVLNVLLKEGLAVLSCSYTKLNQKLHCTIRTDVGSRKMNDSDLCLLREKLGANEADWKSSSSRSSQHK